MEAEIFINQIGYKPQDKKTVFVSEKEISGASGNSGAGTFVVCDAATGKEVLSGPLVSAPSDEESGGSYYTGDFSGVNAAGRYFVSVGNKKSFEFCVSEKPYDEVFLSSLKYFTDS